MSAKPPRPPKTAEEKQNQKRVIVIIENANLEIAKTGKKYALLNCDDHQNLLAKNKKDPADYRPDITHQMLMQLLDSPLNKSGHMQVYIHTSKGVLIEVNPQIRIPRTFKRFCGLMVQLLFKLSIHAANGSEVLMRVIKNPVTDHLPVGIRKIGTSFKGTLVNVDNYVRTFDQEAPVCFVFGGMAHGSIEVDYTDELVSFSEYPLSGAVAVGRLTNAFERMWNIH
eukprot:c1783_g1_i2.p1 GENE.c1783_g1_i2~~c1783_g1_i2.p1  ORF type:complete len:251 (-),score=53.70 c1783_g1_i2:136-810(-)